MFIKSADMHMVIFEAWTLALGMVKFQFQLFFINQNYFHLFPEDVRIIYHFYW